MMIAVGVDTHKHQHLAVAVDALGQLLAEITITATLAGYRELLAWITGLEGEIRVGIEGAGSYGAGLCEYLQDNGITVFEVERPNAASDAPASPTGSTRCWPQRRCSPMMGSPPQEGTASAWRCRCCSSLTALSSASAHASITSSRPSTSAHQPRSANGSGQRKNGAKLAQRLTGMRTRPNASLQENTTLQVLRDIANRTRALDQQAQDYTRQIDDARTRARPALMDEPGVGPICAAKLIAFNPARFKSEAAFARANGTAPQPASSGKTVRHRLSRGGDRQINTAIYTIALSRSVHHPPAAPTSNAESTKARPSERP